MYLASFDLQDTLGVFVTLIMENKSQVMEACGFIKQFVNNVVKKFSAEVYVGGLLVCVGDIWGGSLRENAIKVTMLAHFMGCVPIAFSCTFIRPFPFPSNA